MLAENKHEHGSSSKLNIAWTLRISVLYQVEPSISYPSAAGGAPYKRASHHYVISTTEGYTTRLCIVPNRALNSYPSAAGGAPYKRTSRHCIISASEGYSIAHPRPPPTGALVYRGCRPGPTRGLHT